MTEHTRSARARRLVAEAGDAEAVLATSPANVAYLLGVELASDAVYGTTMGGTWVVAAGSGEIRVIASAIDLPVVLRRVSVDEVVAHGAYLFPEAPADHPLHAVERLSRDEALRRVLDQLDVSGRVVVDSECPTPFVHARARKGPEEIETLCHVNRVAEEALLGALRAVRPGVTERALTGAIHAGMLARGAQPRLCIVGFGARGAIPQDYPSDRRLQVGDTIRCDLNCTIDGYNADLARTAVLGPPSRQVAAAYHGILAGADAAVADLCAGVTAGGLWSRAVEAARAGGLDGYERNHCGHGIGLEVYEAPILARDAGAVLEEDMVVCVETLWLVPGSMGMQVEDAYIVRRDGAERLASGSRELIVIDP